MFDDAWCDGMTDPNASKCDSECGAVTAGNVGRFVACRQQCVAPDFAGMLKNGCINCNVGFRRRTFHFDQTGTDTDAVALQGHAWH